MREEGKKDKKKKNRLRQQNYNWCRKKKSNRGVQ